MALLHFSCFGVLVNRNQWVWRFFSGRPIPKLLFLGTGKALQSRLGTMEVPWGEGVCRSLSESDPSKTAHDGDDAGSPVVVLGE